MSLIEAPIVGEVVAIPDRTPTLSWTAQAFFADKDLAANSRRIYRRTLDALTADLGADLPVDKLTTARVKRVLGNRWGDAAPATWNAHVAALRSFVRYCRGNGWIKRDLMVAIDRKRVPRDLTKAIAYDDLDALWSRPDIGLREKTLWRLLYETAARATEILALNIEDLDLARRRAVVIGKGGHREVIIWASSTARLLPRYLAGRKRGPVFVSNRRPNVAPADADVCPDTGRGRLSYERASSAFKEASGGWTLHQLRHSSLTHLGEEGASAVLIQAKSRHRDPRTLARYAKPGIEAVAALTAEFDRSRRHR